MASIEDILQQVSAETQDAFESRNSVLTFAEWMGHLKNRPYALTRSAPQYIRDMMLYFGTEEVAGVGGMATRFVLFDGQGSGTHRVIGQEAVQMEIYETLCEFVQRGACDRLLLLHGPNGAAKSSIVQVMMEGMEAYSKSDEGSLFTFNWIFSESADRGERLGFDPVTPDEDLSSFARLDSDRISAKIASDFGDSPLLLIPRKHRMAILEEFVLEAAEDEQLQFQMTRFLSDMELSPKSKAIHDALLSAYNGDWEKVLKHVQVERLTISRRYRRGAVTIEPQTNVDAQSRELGHPNMSGLPPVLQNLALFEARGDLVDGNNGIVEYSDFFKRSMEANKYLLTTAENGRIQLDSMNAYLNCLLIGTSNEDYLDAFRQEGMSSSFMPRFHLVRVPYVLSIHAEADIYWHHMQELPQGIHVPKKTPLIAAKWAVMTRLRAPSMDHGGELLKRVARKLTPLQKAHLYNSGRTPSEMTEEERRELLGSLYAVCHEYDQIESEFEGRRGCSPREMLTVMSDLALSADVGCLTPGNVLGSLRELITGDNALEFLSIKKQGRGFHDTQGFMAEIESELLESIAQDVFEASELIEPGEFGRLFERYFDCVRVEATRDRTADKKIGADATFMKTTEASLGIESDAESFRSKIMARVASFRLDNPDAPIVPTELFNDYVRALRVDYFARRLSKIKTLLEQVHTVRSGLGESLESADVDAATSLWDSMVESEVYCEVCLQESLSFLLSRIDDLQ